MAEFVCTDISHTRTANDILRTYNSKINSFFVAIVPFIAQLDEIKGGHNPTLNTAHFCQIMVALFGYQ